MNRQRIGKPSCRTCYHTELIGAIGKLLPHRGLPLQIEDGRVRWTPRLLATCAILMSWLPGRALKDSFMAAREALVAMYDSRRRPGDSCEGFLAALAKSSKEMLATVVLTLQNKTQDLAGNQWRWEGWVVMGVDGSRVECPMTKANELAMGCAGKDKTTPQLFLTTLFHVGTGLPWCWKRGGGKESERNHLRQMIGQLPPRTLLLADAGFTGYELLRSLKQAGHDFIVRVGHNVTLLRKLGYCVQENKGIVYLWPLGFRDQKPLVLRLVKVRQDRKRMCLLTNVLDGERLSDGQIYELYKLRWGVEVLFRSFKQTMEHREMRCGSPDHAKIELDWAMVGLWMLGLISQEAIGRRRRLERKWSVAKSLRIVRGAIRRVRQPRAKGGLRHQLRDALQDNYVRNRPKKARHWPHKKREQPPGIPIVRMATNSEVKAAQRVSLLRLTG